MQQTINSSILAAGLTDKGCIRERNEDAFVCDPDNGLFIVTDGVGGHAAGDIASRMVVEEYPRLLSQHIGGVTGSNNSRNSSPRTVMADCLMEISRRIYNAGKDRLDRKSMGTTAVAVWIVRRHANIVNMGDSRVYLLRRGLLRQLTHDHSVVGYLLRHGEITLREAADHPAKGHLTRYVGMEAAVDPETHGLQLQSGDRVLLCTDGLWGVASDADIQKIMADTDAPDTICRSLIDAGKKAGAPDNLTAVVIVVGHSASRSAGKEVADNVKSNRVTA